MNIYLLNCSKKSETDIEQQPFHCQVEKSVHKPSEETFFVEKDANNIYSMIGSSESLTSSSKSSLEEYSATESSKSSLEDCSSSAESSIFLSTSNENLSESQNENHEAKVEEEDSEVDSAIELSFQEVCENSKIEKEFCESSGEADILLSTSTENCEFNQDRSDKTQDEMSFISLNLSEIFKEPATEEEERKIILNDTDLNHFTLSSVDVGTKELESSFINIENLSSNETDFNHQIIKKLSKLEQTSKPQPLTLLGIINNLSYYYCLGVGLRNRY